MGVEHRTSGRHSTEMEKVLLRTDISVVSLLKFLELLYVFIQLTLFWVWNSVNPLEVIVLFFTQPICRGVFQYFEPFNFVSWRQVRTCTQIDKVSATVGWGKSVLWDFIFDQLSFERVVRKHFQSFCLCQYNSLKRLFFLNVFFELFFNSFIICLWNAWLSHEWVIEKSMIERRTMCKPSSIEIFQSLT